MSEFLWLDDDDERVRLPIFNNFAKTAHICIEILKSKNIEYISLDHDLGENNGEGYDIVLWIENTLYTNSLGETHYNIPQYYNVHSLNGPASYRMYNALLHMLDKYPHIIKHVSKIPYDSKSKYHILEQQYYKNLNEIDYDSQM